MTIDPNTTRTLKLEAPTSEVLDCRVYWLSKEVWDWINPRVGLNASACKPKSQRKARK